ncbi:MAG: peptidoglycan -binding protein [Pseudomonadota bacterium]
MPLTRRTGRFQGSIWPGFVDAMTALLLVLIFVLTIFMVIQSIQNETITGQENALNRLTAEVSTLSQALGAAQSRNTELEENVAQLGVDLDAALSDADFQSQLVEALTQQAEQRTAELDAAEQRIVTLETSTADLETALATARAEIDAGAEAARLAAARREALEALVADLRSDVEDRDTELASIASDLAAQAEALSEEEAARLAEAAAAEALRDRLANADAELSARDLALEELRQEAEDTLTLLAAAERARDDLDARLAASLLEGETSAERLAEAQAALEAARQQLAEDGDSDAELRRRLAAAVAARAAAETEAADRLSELEARAALLRTANAELSDLEAASADDQRRLTALNAQVSALRNQMGELQALLDASEASDVAANVRIEALGAQLNAALARVAAEQRARAELEEAERLRLSQEAEQLERYRSEFFGRLREVLGEREGVQVVGDRFVFSSEVLFDSGSAILSAEGRNEVAEVAQLLQEVAAVIPPEINWIIRVDGHTDTIPVSSGRLYDDNWELSQARALSVVRFMIDEFGFPPDRLAATGFGEFQPVDPADTAEARARNRRIELKLTER